MGLFDDDPFEDILRGIFGNNFLDEARVGREREFISGENEERRIDFVETIDKTYLIFEFPGINEKEISVAIDNGKLNIIVGRGEGVRKLSKQLPKNIKWKNYNYTFENGVLEVCFNKK